MWKYLIEGGIALLLALFTSAVCWGVMSNNVSNQGKRLDIVEGKQDSMAIQSAKNEQELADIAAQLKEVSRDVKTLLSHH
jgi:hypothetical protein